MFKLVVSLIASKDRHGGVFFFFFSIKYLELMDLNI